MTPRTGSTALIVALLVMTPVFAQGRPQTPPPAKGSGTTDTQTRASGGEVKLPATAIHVTGCVSRASDFKADRVEGRGAPVPPDRDQYVLTNATEPSAKASGGAGRRDDKAKATVGRAPAPAGRASATVEAVPTGGEVSVPRAFIGAYGLTGDREPELEQYVGRRIEVVGQVEPQQDLIPPGPSDKPNEKTVPVITIASFRTVEGTCK